ncbi:hypothetical protein [Streptomyces drozdowiczii]|uniref:Uncharacterized protein n=1 Tax=Streptomyces drozdowiczii TaxID=202862 RepID=A0ABY6PXC5_9ACTN|nr:hypothetical protein [Streptomyces drozdowiczii]MCX0243457.1 hypothetical protein [Streptomyces drozdowiczii]UZK56624.1 hypothetical protein NEH16_23320 [Streptomyces drozdowiczii]
MQLSVTHARFGHLLRLDVLPAARAENLVQYLAATVPHAHACAYTRVFYRNLTEGGSVLHSAPGHLPEAHFLIAAADRPVPPGKPLKPRWYRPGGPPRKPWFPRLPHA